MPYIWKPMAFLVIGEKGFLREPEPTLFSSLKSKVNIFESRFKQMGRQCRRWKIGITYSLWFVPLSCWAAEFSLCRSFRAVMKAGAILREIKPAFIQAYLQPKLYNHLNECSVRSTVGVRKQKMWEVSGFTLSSLLFSLSNSCISRC